MNCYMESELEHIEKPDIFFIDSLSKATWAFKKLKAIEQKKREIKQVAKEEKALIEEWEKKELKELEDNINFFEGELIAYYKAEKEKDKKFKLKTPFGALSSRKKSVWLYDDEAGLIDYCKNNNIEAVRVTEELDKVALKSMFKDGINLETGEVLPYVRVWETESFNVKVE